MSRRLYSALCEREFSATAQSIDWVSQEELELPPPPGLPLEITRKPWEAISFRKFTADVPSAEQAPLLQTTIGMRCDGRVDGR